MADIITEGTGVRRVTLSNEFLDGITAEVGSTYPVAALARMEAPTEVGWQTPEGEARVMFVPDGSGAGKASQVAGHGSGAACPALVWRTFGGCGFLEPGDGRKASPEALRERAPILVAANALRLVEYGLTGVTPDPAHPPGSITVTVNKPLPYVEEPRGWIALFDEVSDSSRIVRVMRPPARVEQFAAARACEHVAFFEDTLGRKVPAEGVLALRISDAEEEDYEFLASTLADMLGTSVFALRRQGDGILIHALDETDEPAGALGRASAEGAIADMRAGIQPGLLPAQAIDRIERRRAGH